MIREKNHVLEFIKEMEKPLTSTKIQNSAYLLQTKEQGFPKGTYNFNYKPEFFMNSPRLTFEISDLENFGYITEEIKNNKRLFYLNPESNNIKKEFFNKRYTNFLKENIENIGLISLDNFLIDKSLTNKTIIPNEKFLINKSQQITGIENQDKLEQAAKASKIFWKL
ncbi:MAG TPA: hypothetical protein VJ912_01560 [Candidatus Nanoarchaeia archaeon]|nr:hypothetical protein [Candidatus Nanoarchaeia archaeon]